MLNRPMAAPAPNIRNFSIIAHIDHGKSTLADRILEITGAVDARDHRPQLLDSMDLERERGITIKAQAVRVEYTARDGQLYRLHLIDTPGHVDFTYEVSRSLAACDGALLLVDASQGVEAQTVANTYLAVDSGLELIPAMNKIDLPGAEPERVAGEIGELLGEDPEAVLRISAKTGDGVDRAAGGDRRARPAAGGRSRRARRALIFDSEFDQYRGVVAYVRVVDGALRKGKGPSGRCRPAPRPRSTRSASSVPTWSRWTSCGGEVGYLITGIKDVSQLRVGDTLTTEGRRRGRAAAGLPRDQADGVLRPLPGRDQPVSRPARRTREAELNDAALTWEPETSEALGFGFRCGFLGLLHMDIVRERLEREYDLELLATAPNVEYDVHLTDGSELVVHSPRGHADRPDRGSIEEPYIRATILPEDPVGAVMELCQERRGIHVDMTFLSQQRVQLHYDLPLAEIVLDFFDQLKSRARLCLARLRGARDARGRPREARHPAGRRQGGRALDGGPPRQGLQRRPRPGGAAAQADPAPAVRGGDTGGDRVEDHRPRVGQADAQGRDREVLRRRHHAQAQAAREAEGGQEAHEAGRAHRGAPGGIPGRARASRRHRC